MPARINLDKLSDNELQTLRAEVMAKVVERLKLDPGGIAAYDRHGSGHSNSTSTFRDIGLTTKTPTRG